MPLNDLADYTGDFFLANVNISLLAKDETPWGKDVPEDIFLHYVLPYRINNENLDSFRIVYYNEISDRIRGKNLKEAALEINHWCHEKVNYQSADIRTSAPMSTILSARGRCGEESTFTVAALRTAGIPARQVYTPRWAHSDDNHAWVEIWDNGTWYYIGACEPEPVFDQGWFTEPARRAMLIHTKSFGASLGNENSIVTYSSHTEVNNLSKYAITKKIIIKVLDKNGASVCNAKVEYQLYNYAEFYPLAVVPTDENGISRFETGLGDLLIWAHKDDDFEFKKISVRETDTLVLKLMRQAGGKYNYDLDLNVPVIPEPFAGPAPELIEQNSKRINNENLIRKKYVDSWMKPEEAKRVAINLNIDTAKFKSIIARSMGNYNVIRNFLSKTPDSLKNRAMSLLEVISEKDLRDIKGDVLSDHLQNVTITQNFRGEKEYKMFVEFILNPRVANEMVVAWRGFFRKNLPALLLEKATGDPSLIIKYLNENIKIAEDENYYKTPLTPKGVIELKVADTESRAICFVAICRSLGIPSRIEPGSNVSQYFSDSKWNDVYFNDQKKPSQKKGFLKMISNEKNPIPEYYLHFTIARFENGRYNTLEYDYNKKISDFSGELSLSPGSFMLVTGNRLNSGKILSNISFFDLAGDEHKTIEVKLRKETSENTVSGKIDLKDIKNLFFDNKKAGKIIDYSGVVIIWFEPDLEPTTHIINDLIPLKHELDSWGGCFLFLSNKARDGKLSKYEEIKELPSNSFFGVDNKLEILKSYHFKNCSLNSSLPYIIMADKDSNIVFTSSGYRIGIGEQILKHIIP